MRYPTTARSARRMRRRPAPGLSAIPVLSSSPRRLTVHQQLIGLHVERFWTERPSFGVRVGLCPGSRKASSRDKRDTPKGGVTFVTRCDGRDCHVTCHGCHGSHTYFSVMQTAPLFLSLLRIRPNFCRSAALRASPAGVSKRPALRRASRTSSRVAARTGCMSG